MSIGDDLGFALELVGERLELGGDELAGPAPLGGKLDEHGQLAREHLALEVLLADRGDGHSGVLALPRRK